VSEQTPTTGQVKGWYVAARGEYQFVIHSKYEAEFHRWLEQHDAEIAKATEERIIKLLEKHSKSFISARYDGNLRNYHIKFDTDRFAALVKWENK